MREQGWNSTSLAQESPSRLSKSCRVSCLVLVRVSRLGDFGRIERLGLSLRRETLAQARSRSDLGILSVISHPGERFWVLSDGHSRPGESDSPKRVFEVQWCCFVETLSRRGLCVVLGKGVTRPGERISPKRDKLMMLLF